MQRLNFSGSAIRTAGVRAVMLVASVLVAGCASGAAAGSSGDGAVASPAPGQPVAPASAPWEGPRLQWDELPGAYRIAWEQAENRTTCAPLAVDPSFVDNTASARRAQFGGGWGVAYDLPEQRSAFGVAGTGVDADAPAYEGFPHTIRWADGSFADYGLEGGNGPNHLAYLRVAGQSCLYNVWSALGQSHLEALLARLRFVG